MPERGRRVRLTAGAPPALATRRVMAITSAAFFTATGVAGMATVMLLQLGPDDAEGILLTGAAGSVVVGALILAFGRHIDARGHLALILGGIVNLTFLLAIAPNTSIAVAALCIYPCYGCHAAFVLSWRMAAAVAAFAVPCCVVGVVLRDDVQWPTALLPATVLVILGVTVAVLSRLAAEAEVDALTGIRNQRGFDRALGKALDESGSLAVVMFDVDRFDAINERFGYRAGDDVLRRTSACLSAAAPEDAVVARYGGDEFAVLLFDVTETCAADIAERLRVALDVDCSAGVTSRRSGDTASLLVGRAGTALYRAKSAGRSATVLESALGPTVVAELLRAIEEEAIDVHYQPIVDLANSGTVIAVEALLRWTSTEQPDLTAADIVELAETNGLIERLGEAVLRRACADAPTMQRRLGNAPLSVNVNVSILELADIGYVDHVLEVLRETGWPPEQLILELTESSIAARSSPVQDILDRLRRNGIRIAIDDFGSGYSSLNRLATLPFDALKVDRSVVANAPTARRILCTIVALAAAFDLEIVVEGIETDTQEALVREVGITRAQGYRFGRPVAVEDLPVG